MTPDCSPVQKIPGLFLENVKHFNDFLGVKKRKHSPVRVLNIAIIPLLHPTSIASESKGS